VTFGSIEAIERDGGVRYADCPFCDPIPELVLFESVYSRVLFANSSLLEGHLIVASRDHAGAATNLPGSQVADLLDLQNRAKSVLGHASGECVVHFEHGEPTTAEVKAQSSHCLHPHMNLVPSDALCGQSSFVVEVLRTFGLVPCSQAFVSLSECYSFAAHEPADYYILGSGTTYTLLAGPSKTERAFRRAFAKVLRLDEEVAARWEARLSPEAPQGSLADQLRCSFDRVGA